MCLTHFVFRGLRHTSLHELWLMKSWFTSVSFCCDLWMAASFIVLDVNSKPHNKNQYPFLGSTCLVAFTGISKEPMGLVGGLVVAIVGQTCWKIVDRWRALHIQSPAAKRPVPPPDRRSGRMAWKDGNESRLLLRCSPDRLHCGNEKCGGRTAEANQTENCLEPKMKSSGRKPQYPCKILGEIQKIKIKKGNAQKYNPSKCKENKSQSWFQPEGITQFL